MPARSLTPGPDVSPLSAGDRRALGRFLEQSLDRGFRLAIVEAAGHADREAVLAEVAPIVGPGLLLVAIDELAGAHANPWLALKLLVEERAPRCLALWGFENLSGPDWPRRLNIQRDLFVRDVPVPWLLFIHPASRVLLRRDAPDFCDFAVLWLRDERPPHRPEAFTSAQAVPYAEISSDTTADAPLLQQAGAALDAARFDEARDALYRFDLQSDHDVLDRIDRQLVGARCERVTGRLGPAEALVRNARNTLERLPLAARSRSLKRQADFELAQVLFASGRLEEAEKLLRQDLPALDDALNPGALKLHTFLATILSERGKLQEAEHIVRDVLVRQERTLGREHLDSTITLYILAGILVRQGRASEAESILRVCLARPERSLGPEHPVRAASLHLLAEALLQQGRSAEAEPILQASLSLLERTLGRDHPNYAITLNALARVLVQRGDYTEADRLLRESLSVVEKALGHDHRQLYLPLVELALVARARGRTDEALHFLERALRIADASLGENHPEVRRLRELFQALAHPQ